VNCTATVINNLTGYPIGSAIVAGISQCQNPGNVTTETCTATPAGNSQTGSGGPGGQSVSQCNASGGAGGTMTCTVTAPASQSTGLPTTIAQCNGSGPTGASTVTCTATIPTTSWQARREAPRRPQAPPRPQSPLPRRAVSGPPPPGADLAQEAASLSGRHLAARERPANPEHLPLMRRPCPRLEWTSCPL
jgi:hypothetical protein